MKIESVDTFSELPAITLAKPKPAPGGDFAAALGQALEAVSESSKQAEAQNGRFVQQDLGKLHENAIALEKANIALRMMVSVRNKVLDAYRDVMHMSG